MEVLDEPREAVQPETFRQGTEAPEPEPVAAPAPVPEPAAEAPPVEPSWLNEPAPAPEPDYIPPPQQYQQPPPQQPPQYSPPPPSGGSLEQFVEAGPDAYIDRRVAQIVEQRLAQTMGPLVQDYQMNKAQQQRVQQTTTAGMVNQADAAITRAYGAFNKDPAFKSHKGLQERLENTLKGIRSQAIVAAEMGDYGPLNNISNMNEGHYKAALAAARAIENVGSPGTGPMQIEGAGVETTRPAVTETHIDLNAEQQAIADRIGGNYADRFRTALKETASADDFEV
jgi:hypothetical protein